MIPEAHLDSPEKLKTWEEFFRNFYCDRDWAIQNYLKIRTKDQRLSYLKFNSTQRKLNALVDRMEALMRPVRIIIVKPRKVGISTDIQALFFHRSATRKLQKSMTVAHDMDSTEEMFQMNDLFYNELPAELQPEKRYGSREEIVFENPDEATRSVRPGLRSQLGIGTAGKLDLGRSKDIHLLHCSESAFWTDAEKTELSLLNAVPDLPSTMVFKESTPNGVGTKFHNDYEDAKAGRTAFSPFFEAWQDVEEYVMPLTMRVEAFEDSLDDEELKMRAAYNLTNPQLNWRRWAIENKCGRDPFKFMQEYPDNDVDCLERETRVGTSRGIRRICDVEVGSVSDHGRVIAKANKGVRNIVRVATKRGYTVRATPEHLLAVDGKFQFCHASHGAHVTLQPPKLAETIHVETWTGLGGVEHRLTIDEKWAAWLGYFMGDGSFFGDTLSMVCDGKDEDLVELIGALSMHVWGVGFERRRVGTNKGGREWRANNKDFGPILEALGCLKTAPGLHGLKRKVCIPESIWQSPKPVITIFLKYLFEADGWASPKLPLIKFFSKYPDFIRDVQRLLLAFGIPSTIRPVTKKTDGKEFPGCELILNAREAILFMREIGFVSMRKSEGCAAQCREPLMDKRCPPISMTDEVVSVESDGTAEVWDLQIEGQPVFGAGGILVHNCFLVSGRPRFDPKLLRRLLLEVKTPVVRGMLRRDGSLVRLEEHQYGFVRIWKPPHPARRYVLGADVAEGIEGGDYSCAHVYDWDSVELVAEWHGHVEPDLFGDEVGKLGKVYNNCLVGVEANKDGGTVNTRLRNDGYPHLFYRQETENRTNRRTAKLGWLTNTATKPLMINSLADAARDGASIPSRETVQEMMTFVVHENGTVGAQSGCHDDRVISSAIAQELRKRQGLGRIYSSLNR